MALTRDVFEVFLESSTLGIFVHEHRSYYLARECVATKDEINQYSRRARIDGWNPFSPNSKLCAVRRVLNGARSVLCEIF